ncbi:MAG: hypothetical protein MZU84_05320 [Sphingobacterium sp.]|nr:hypothetical protein [Sphingobacterium sp.]
MPAPSNTSRATLGASGDQTDAAVHDPLDQGRVQIQPVEQFVGDQNAEVDGVQILIRRQLPGKRRAQAGDDGDALAGYIHVVHSGHGDSPEVPGNARGLVSGNLRALADSSSNI